MVLGQKSRLESQIRRRKCMTEEEKERYRESRRLYAQKNKEKISARQKMIYETARKYRNKCECK